MRIPSLDKLGWMRRMAVALCLPAVVALWAGEACGQGGPPRIHARFHGGVLNVNVSNIPAGAAVEVIVRDLSNGGNERPNGEPPDKATAEGTWPGEEAGGETGYPGTADDPGGTRYSVTVRVNGATGPSLGVSKPMPFLKKLVRWITLGLARVDERPKRPPSLPARTGRAALLANRSADDPARARRSV